MAEPHLYSDNGTNLRGSKTELRKSIKEIDFRPLESIAANNAVEWSFITPATHSLLLIGVGRGNVLFGLSSRHSE